MASSSLSSTQLEFTNTSSNTGLIKFNTDNTLESDRAFKFSQGLITSSMTVGDSSNFSVSTTYSEINLNELKLTAPSNGDSYAITLPGTAGSDEQILVSSGNSDGLMDWKYLSQSLPKRWEFGITKFKWTNLLSTPTLLSTFGDAVYSNSTTGNHFYSLTTSAANKNGALQYVFSTSDASGIGDFEMRFQLKCGSGGADLFYFFAGADSAGYGGTNSGHSVELNHYSGNSNFVRLFDGNSTIVTNTSKATSFNDGYYHEFFLRRIGSTLSFGLLPSSATTTSFHVTGTTTSSPTGRYYGVGGKTGSSYTYHELSYIEMRTLGSSASITSETD